MPPDPLAFVAEGRDALDDQIGRGDLVKQQIVSSRAARRIDSALRR